MTTANNQKYFPMLVPSSRGAVDSSEDIVARWGKFRSLPEESRKMLTSKEMNELLHRYEREYSLSEDVVEDFSRSVRNLFFGDMDQNAFLGWLVSVTGARQEQVTEIYNSIVSIIPTEDDDMGDEDEIVSTEEAREYESLSLRDAAKQFPGIGEQLLSDESLKLSDGREVRPSVANWVRLYRAKLGVERHGTMERGNFLFHDSNTLHLDSSERRRLATVLKSLDEETNVLVDPEQQIIVFVDRVTNSSQYSEIGDTKKNDERGIPPNEKTVEQAGSEVQPAGHTISVKLEDEHEAQPLSESQPHLDSDDDSDQIQHVSTPRKAKSQSGEASDTHDEGREKLERMVTEATLTDAGVNDWKPSITESQQLPTDREHATAMESESDGTGEAVVPQEDESEDIHVEQKSDDTLIDDSPDESYTSADSIQEIVPPEPELVSSEALQAVGPKKRVGATLNEGETAPATVRRSWTSEVGTASDQFSVVRDQDQSTEHQEDSEMIQTEKEESSDRGAHPVSWEKDEGIHEMPDAPVFVGRRFEATTEKKDVQEETPKSALRSSQAFENAFGVKAPIPMQVSEQVAEDSEEVTEDSEQVVADSELVAKDNEQVAVDSEQVVADSELVAKDNEQVAVDSEQVVADSEQEEEVQKVKVSKPKKEDSIETPSQEEEEAVIPVTNEALGMEEHVEEPDPQARQPNEDEHAHEDHEQEEMQYHLASIRPFSTRSRMSSRFSRHGHSHTNLSETVDPDVFADETERFRRRIESRGDHVIGGTSLADVATPEDKDNVLDMRFSSNQVFPAENDIDTVESVVETTTGDHKPSPNRVELS